MKTQAQVPTQLSRLKLHKQSKIKNRMPSKQRLTGSAQRHQVPQSIRAQPTWRTQVQAPISNHSNSKVIPNQRTPNDHYTAARPIKIWQLFQSPCRQVSQARRLLQMPTLGWALTKLVLPCIIQNKMRTNQSLQLIISQQTNRKLATCGNQ